MVTHTTFPYESGYYWLWNYMGINSPMVVYADCSDQDCDGAYIRLIGQTATVRIGDPKLATCTWQGPFQYPASATSFA